MLRDLITWAFQRRRRQSRQLVRPRQRHRRFVSWLVLACLAFTQLAFAAQPCVTRDASATDAFAATPDCHQPPSANLCLAECTALDRTSSRADTGTVAFLPALLATLPAAQPVSCGGEGPAPAAAPVRAAGPPPYLRLCSLLL